MASNLGWLQRAQSHPATFTSLRTGQWPKHPRPVKEEKPGKDPPFMDDGGPAVSNPVGGGSDTPWWLSPSIASALQDNPDAMPPTAEQTPQEWFQTPEWQQQNSMTTLPELPEGMQDQNGQRGTWENSNLPLDDRPDWMKNPTLKPEQADASAQATGPEPTTPDADIANRNGGIDPLASTGVPGAAERQADLRDQLRQYPVNAQPKWWQRALGAIAGGAAGVSNASGHTRRPIDIDAMRQNILNPGYADKLQEWQSEYAPMAAQVNMDAAQRQAQIAAQKEQSTAALQSAEAQRAIDQGKYWAGQGKTNMITVTPEISKATNGLFPVGHQISSADMKEVIHDILTAPTPAKVQTLKVLTQAIADATGQPIGSDVPTAVYEKAMGINNPTDRNVTDSELRRRAALGDQDAMKALQLGVTLHNQEKTQPSPEAQAMRQEAAALRRTTADQTTDNDKINAQGKAFDLYQKQINSPNATTEQKAQAKAQYVSSLQGIQDAYARTVRARGGSADDFNVVASPTGVDYVPRTPARPPAPTQGIAHSPAIGAANPYIVGRTYSGLKYLGGDPKSQASWQTVR